MLTIELSATQDVAIKAALIRKDAEGNETDRVDVAPSDLEVWIENEVGTFGTIDASDTFHPGDAGATGEIHGSYVDAEGTEWEAAVAVTLIPGEPTSEGTLALDFVPKTASDAPPSDGGDPGDENPPVG